MGNIFFINIIEYLNNVSTLYILLLEIIVSYFAVLFMFRLWGKDGLFVYVTMAIILANIQVLKLVSFPLLPEPIAMGTVVFVSTFFASNIINEYYGKIAALNLLTLSFVSYLLFMLLMMIFLSYEPISQSIANARELNRADWSWALAMQDHMMAIFSPAPSIFLSSLLAYAASQTTNIGIFSKLLAKIGPRFIWIRGFLSSSISNLVDNTVFSVFAFYILAKEPLSWHVLIYSYILGVFFLRIMFIFIESPMLALSHYFKPASLTKGNV